MERHTKIVATLGPASDKPSTLQKMIAAGMDVARLNCSHGNKEQFKAMVKNLRTLERETGKTILTLLDLQGPKIRLGALPTKGILVRRGEKLIFHTGRKAHPKKIHLPHVTLAKAVKAGETLLIEDGLIRTKILFTKGKDIHVEVEVGGILKSHKGVNIPDSTLPQRNFLSQKDLTDLRFGIKVLKVDAVALSFVEKAADILEVKQRIQQWTSRRVLIVAKIERPKALLNLHEITQSSDGLMVARGDLGIEIPAEQVPIEQRRILAAGREWGKPVIVATQVLDSMVENPLPTRAEMSDAATAIFEQTDAFMLSNESAVGKYPVKAVQTLAKVACYTEKAMQENNPYAHSIDLNPIGGDKDRHTLATEALQLARVSNAKTLVVYTKDGQTAQNILRLRPTIPVVVLSSSKETARLLHFHWGIHRVILYRKKMENPTLKRFLKKQGLKGLTLYLQKHTTHHELTMLEL